MHIDMGKRKRNLDIIATSNLFGKNTKIRHDERIKKKEEDVQ